MFLLSSFWRQHRLDLLTFTYIYKYLHVTNMSIYLPRFNPNKTVSVYIYNMYTCIHHQPSIIYPCDSRNPSSPSSHCLQDSFGPAVGIAEGRQQRHSGGGGQHFGRAETEIHLGETTGTAMKMGYHIIYGLIYIYIWYMYDVYDVYV